MMNYKYGYICIQQQMQVQLKESGKQFSIQSMANNHHLLLQLVTLSVCEYVQQFSQLIKRVLMLNTSHIATGFLKSIASR